MPIETPDRSERFNSHSRKNSASMSLMGCLGLASMLVCGFALSRSLTYRVTAQVVVPSDRADKCIELLEADSSRPAITYEQTMRTKSVTVFQIARETYDMRAAQSDLDALAAKLADQIAASTTAKPTQDDRTVQLEAKLRELDRATHPLTNGGQAGAGIEQLIHNWQEQLSGRQTLTSQLKDVDAKLTAKPFKEADVTLSAAAIADAEARDQKVQADVQALQQREARLSQLLNELLTAGEPILERYSAAINTAEKLVAEHVEEEQTTDLAALLTAIRKHLSDLFKVGNTFFEVWTTQRSALSTPGRDPLNAQRLLETAAKIFQSEASASKLALHKTLESIGEGADQPTKRLVLRNTISQQLEECMAAYDAAGSVAVSIVLLDNRELAALVESVAGLRSKVREQKNKIFGTLRQQELAKARSEYQASIAAAQAERGTLAKRATELDAAILATGNQLLKAIQDDQAERGTLAQNRDVHQQRAEILSELLARVTEKQRVLMESEPTMKPFFVSAQAMLLLPDRPAIVRAMLLGASPLAAGFLIWMIISIVCVLRRSRQNRAEYAEIMESASQRPREKR